MPRISDKKARVPKDPDSVSQTALREAMNDQFSKNPCLGLLDQTAVSHMVFGHIAGCQITDAKECGFLCTLHESDSLSLCLHPARVCINLLSRRMGDQCISLLHSETEVTYSAH